MDCRFCCYFIVLVQLVFFHCYDGLPLVEIPGLGSIRGTIEKTTISKRTFYQFLGVPYAESPSKELRFKAPVLRSSWKGILNATKFGRECPKEYLLRNLKKDELKKDVEDCLSLSIFTPNLNGNYSVMVYIHGGSFYTGSVKIFTGHNLLEKNVVLVVPQYRVGALGFLFTGTSDIPGNMGLLDISLCLTWVQNYIEHFGGNPASVTIFGQSAGAAIASALMISPLTSRADLFHRVIVQSGSVTAKWATKPASWSMDVSETICKEFKHCSCQSAELIYECLKNASVLQILQASKKDDLFSPNLFALTIGDYYNALPDEPRNLFQNSFKYPLMTGVTRQDGSYILANYYDDMKTYHGNNLKNLDPSEYINGLIASREYSDDVILIRHLVQNSLFNVQDIENHNYMRLYPGLIDLAGILDLKSPALELAQLNVKNNTLPTYLYTFDYRGKYTRFGYGADTSHYPFYGGAHHSNDYLYLFPMTHGSDTAMIEKMVSLWTSFAIKGQPSAKNTPIWNPLKNYGPYMHINLNSTIGNNFLNEFTVTVREDYSTVVKKKKNTF